MALMKFREPNQVRWQGVRPAHNGEQVMSGNAATGVVDTILYTVPVGKTLFVTYAALSFRMSAVGINVSRLRIYTDVPAPSYTIIFMETEVQGYDSKCVSFSFPIELDSGYTLRVENNNANAVSHGVIIGWIE